MATTTEFRTLRIFWPCCLFDQKLCHVTMTASGLPIRAMDVCLPLKVMSILVNYFAFSCTELTRGTWLCIQLSNGDTLSVFRCPTARQAAEGSMHVGSAELC